MEMIGSGWIVLWLLVFTFIQPSVTSENQTFTSGNDVTHVTATLGTTAILPCAMKGKDPSEMLLWLNPQRDKITLEDRRLTSDIRFSVERPFVNEWNLYIRDVGVRDSGRYTCVLLSDPIIQKDIILTLREEDVTPEPHPSPVPAIATTQTTENITVLVRVPVGSTAVLPCQMDAKDNYTVIWVDPRTILLTLRDRRIVDNPRISVHTHMNTYNLHISNVRVEDSGSYMCQMNTNPVTTKSVDLIVEEPGTSPMPVTDISVPMENETVYVWFPTGSTAVLPCVMDTQNGTFSVLWSDKWSTLVTTSDVIFIGDTRFTLTWPYEHTWNLHIANVTAEDSGNYTCQMNTDPVTIKTVVLTVEDLSTTLTPVTDTPEPTEPTVIHVTVAEGRDAVLPCWMNTMGGRYKVAWADKWSTMITIDDTVIQNDPRIALLQPSVDTWNLQIANVTTEYSGNYSCQMNSIPFTIRHVLLTVETPPSIVWVETNAADDSFVVSCAATGDPTPNITWYEAGNELPGETEEVLHIKNMSYETQEVVKCVASNELGQTERNFLPGRLYIQQVGPRNAFLRLKMSPGYNDAEYMIYNVTAKVYDGVDKNEITLDTKLKDGAYSMLYGFNTSTKYIISANAMSEVANVLLVPETKFSLKPRASTALVVSDAVGQVHESRGPRKKNAQAGPQFVAIDKQDDADVVINLSSFHRVKVSSYRGTPCPNKECGMLKLYSYKASGVLKHQTSVLFEDDLDFEWAKAHL